MSIIHEDALENQETHTANQPAQRGDSRPDLELIPKNFTHAQNHTDFDGEKDAPIDANEARIVMFRMQSLARKLLPDHRVAWCLRRFQVNRTSMEYRYNPERQRVYYHGLRPCDRLHECPVCARKISEQRRNELEAGLANARFPVIKADGSVFFVPKYHRTLLHFTIQSKLAYSADYALDQLAAALKRFKEGRWWTGFCREYFIVGYLRALEMTDSLEHGWHPHNHTMYLHDSHLSDEVRTEMLMIVRRRWAEKVGDVGGYADPIFGVAMSDPEADKLYPIKAAGDKEMRKWNQAAEVTKATVKHGRGDDNRTMLDLLMAYGRGDEQAGRRWVEGTQALAGRHWLHASPGFWKLLGVDPLTDEQAAQEIAEETHPIWATLNWEDWKLVLKSEARGIDLVKADQGGAEALIAFLRSLGIKSI